MMMVVMMILFWCLQNRIHYFIVNILNIGLIRSYLGLIDHALKILSLKSSFHLLLLGTSALSLNLLTILWSILIWMFFAATHILVHLMELSLQTTVLVLTVWRLPLNHNRIFLIRALVLLAAWELSFIGSMRIHLLWDLLVLDLVVSRSILMDFIALRKMRIILIFLIIEMA